MITVKTVVGFIFSNDNLVEYTRMADDYERKLKDAGIFWSRKDSTTGITISSQKYFDVKRWENDEVQTVSVSNSGDTENRE